jgi:4-hydroxy-tetrahydrodipicolinate reductase
MAEKIPVVQDTNMSVGVNVMNTLVELAAKAFDESFDIEILEAHHRYKTDAPSGTALTLGEAVAKGRGVKLSDEAVVGDRNKTIRKKGEIGFQVIRGGGITGEHTVFYCGDNERLEITHRAADRKIFAGGAMRAAMWLVSQPAGFYRMKDVLGLC